MESIAQAYLYLYIRGDIMANIFCVIKMVIWDTSLFDEAIQHWSSVTDIHLMLDVFHDWLLKKNTT